MSKMGMTELIFVVPAMKVNRQCHRDIVLSQPVFGLTRKAATSAY